MAKLTTGQQILAAVKASFEPPTPPVNVRWVRQIDLPAMAAIDATYPEQAARAELRGRDVIGMVAEAGESVTGFAVYRLEVGGLRLLRLAVADGPAGGAARVELWNRLLGKPDGRNRRELAVPFGIAAAAAGDAVRAEDTADAGLAGLRRHAGIVFDPAVQLTRLRVTELPAVDPSWLTGDVRALAAVEPHPPLPILADALQDAGCADEVLLGVLRADGPVAGRVFAGLRGALRGE